MSLKTTSNMKYRIERWSHYRLVAVMETDHPYIARSLAKFWDDDCCALTLFVNGKELEFDARFNFIHGKLAS